VPAAAARVHRAHRPAPGTATRILDIAEELVQVHGFNGFSYADISADLGIRKASIHHHFPTKADLGARLIGRYRERFANALTRIETSGAEASAMLQQYVSIYTDVLRDKRMCLCGMLAAEITTLPRPLRTALRKFFDENEVWLAALLDKARRGGALAFAGSALAQARLVISSLEGAMLVARSYGDVTRFESAAAILLDSLRGSDRNAAPARSRARAAARR
jgi:TetR/AcrR family transcriptional regulator, transcriptional repressor for nem operon